MRPFVPVLLALFSVSVLRAAEPVDFGRDVWPIFERHCNECHGPGNQSSGLRLDRRSVALRGGDFGVPTIVPSKPDESFLIAVISGDNDHGIRMPPDGDPLPAKQIETLRRWIVEGAAWPGQMEATADDRETDLWSLKPIAVASVGDQDGGVGSHRTGAEVIDQMILVRLRAAGLTLSSEADPITLLRRLSLVLTGLPPTPEELADYLSDPGGTAMAYEKAVDRLLDSPRYGERWAQHWLDVIRWAETVGFETNAARPNAWPYRDWVIDSLNQDKPYDRFLWEQIAGDTVGEDAALGFLVAGPANLPGQVGRDEEAMRQARQDELDEVVQTVSQAAIGLTVGCARCHNHKFDPILQKDYFAMQAIFAGLRYGDRRLRGQQNDLWTDQVPAAKARLDRTLAEAKSLRQRFDLKPCSGSLHTDRFEPILATAVRMEIRATDDGKPPSLYEFEAWTAADSGASRNVALASQGAIPSASSYALANQTRHFDNLIDGSTDRRQAFPWVASDVGPAWIQVDFAEPARIDRTVWDVGSSHPADYAIHVMNGESGQWQVVADSTDRWLRESDRRSASEVQLRGLSENDVSLVVKLNAAARAARAELSRLSAGPQVFAARFVQSPEPTWLLHRGDPMNRREVVAPAVPKALGQMPWNEGDSEPQRRVALAEHLIHRDHPLTSRVIVNRVWQHHFGEGLVDTPSDFGEMGSRPTHPELLDHLALDFVRDGWSLKKLHRRIVRSRTFRQSNRPAVDALQVDADSRLLWRFPPRRLEAEAIRDSILQASGNLNLEMGGRGFDLFQQRGGLADYTALETFQPDGWRRMIYAHKIRMQSVDVFGAFDCPDAGQMKPKRTRSITPIQSLSLFNSPFVMRQSRFFSDRVEEEVGERVDDQVARAFVIAFARSPSDEERDRMSELVLSHGLNQLCRVLMNSSEFLYIP